MQQGSLNNPISTGEAGHLLEEGGRAGWVAHGSFWGPGYALARPGCGGR